MDNLRIIQLIDSLEAGGAERMAVNYANALHGKIAFSGLVVTRKEGPLANALADSVPYLFLQKSKKIDWSAVKKLKRFVDDHKVGIVHAHSTSFFIAVLLKLVCPRISIVWHDHYGNSEFLDKRQSKPLQLASLFFSGTIAVNKKLLDWGKKRLFCSNAIYLPNFVLDANGITEKRETTLQGIDGKRIVCLANLRPQKGHFFLLDIAKKLKETVPEWTFHLVGKDFEDDYSQALRQAIQTDRLEKHVFVYGSRNDIGSILKQSDIGILTSHSEGLPVSLLEYGLFSLPVVVTNVGEIPDIMNAGHGFIIPNNDREGFVSVLRRLTDDKNAREHYGKSLHNLIYTTFVSDAVLGQYLNWLARL